MGATRVVGLISIVLLLLTSAAEAGISVIGGLTHHKKVEPGATYEGSIIVRNTGARAQEAKVYQTDYQFSCDGTNRYGPPGQLKRSNAAWISFNPHRLVIPPSDSVTVNYTVKVPPASDLAGTYWSMLMVEGIPEGSPESSRPEKDKVKVGIVQIMRYGIHMITDIGDGGERQLKFLDTKLSREGEKRVLQLDVENVGQWWLRPMLWVELYDNAGRYLGRFEGGTKRLYPGTSVRYQVDLSDAPQGEYKALLVADCGGDDVFGANYTLKLEK